jgi:hypothetical protein
MHLGSATDACLQEWLIATDQIGLHYELAGDSSPEGISSKSRRLTHVAERFPADRFLTPPASTPTSPSSQILTRGASAISSIRFSKTAQRHEAVHLPTDQVHRREGGLSTATGYRRYPSADDFLPPFSEQPRTVERTAEGAVREDYRVDATGETQGFTTIAPAASKCGVFRVAAGRRP